MKYESRAALFRAAADSIEMQEKAGIKPVWKQHAGGGVLPIINCGSFNCNTFGDGDSFPLGVVEGKPVFAGDVLYDWRGEKFFAGEQHARDALDPRCSWYQPKPKTVMVELTVEDAKTIALNEYVALSSLREACKKALEAI